MTAATAPEATPVDSAFIELTDVGLDYPLLSVSTKRLFTAANLPRFAGGIVRRSKPDSSRALVCALQEISFHLKPGDRLGLIGRNGAGKTTLLRLLAGVYQPTRGHLRSFGRIGALFSTSLGLQPDATGLENIRAMSSFFGIDRNDLAEVETEIAEFTGLGNYLNLPVRIYSTGMLMRLSFAIATAKHPDIVLLDEAIGAGDASFQERTRERLDSFLAQTSILVLASHSEVLIKQFCNQAIVLDGGHIIQQGEVEECFDHYRELTSASAGK